MAPLLAIFFLVMSTALGAVVGGRVLVRFSSPLLALVGCWCLGQIISAQLAYWFSITLVSYGWEGVLVKSNSILLCVSCIAVLTDLSRGPESHVRLIFRALVRHVSLVDVIASILIFSLSTFFYWPHLFVEDGVIKRSQVYWDFNIHFPVIQSFVLGDNFPAENMTFSGIPLTYHFFFDLLCAIYACLGLDLIQGLNWASAVSFGMMLLAIYSACIELFKSRGTAMVAVGLVLTSSSLRFLFDLPLLWRSSLSQWIASTAARHPYELASLASNTAGYNGNMFNLFYFLAERQLTFSVVFIVLTLVTVLHRKALSVGEALALGCLAGLGLHWHLFATISIFLALVMMLVCAPDRSRTMLIVSGMAALLGIELLQLQATVNSGIFLPTIHDVPRINFRFATMTRETGEGPYPLSALNIGFYWLFAYGVKLLLFPLAARSLIASNRDIARIFLAWIVPTFVLINTVQVSPLDIYDNHKWLRPMNVGVDIVIAWFIVSVIWRRTPLRAGIAALLVFAASVSGIIEDIPYAAAFSMREGAKTVSPRRTPLIDLIETHTPPSAAFLTSNALEVHMAGRSSFVSDSKDEPGATGMNKSFRLDEQSRRLLASSLYAATSQQELCARARRSSIDFIEVSEESPALQIQSPPRSAWPLISAKNRRNHDIAFLNLRRFCPPEAAPGDAAG